MSHQNQDVDYDRIPYGVIDYVPDDKGDIECSKQNKH
jgi:hypothetical protein